MVSEIGMIIKYKNFPITLRRVRNIAGMPKLTLEKITVGGGVERQRV